ncbi:MAG: hypothetical protein KatS3mg087_1219 [Patescibacteria group bacterium]|nr:MAG: hypothetical protein KatS3mg087_1219 [Patescibacteria group bacterium]
MFNVTRTRAIELLKALGFSFVDTLSNSRLENKLNRLDTIADSVDLADLERPAREMFNIILDLLEQGKKIQVIEDRATELKKAEEELQMVADITSSKEAKKTLKRELIYSASGKTKQPNSKKKAGPKRTNKRYDWDKIFNGETWLLERGEDFTVPCKSFVVAAYVAARARGIKFKKKILNDRRVVIKAILRKGLPIRPKKN